MWLALYVLCGSMLMIVLDATIVNVALPSIKSELDFDSSSLAWVVNAYLIAFGGLLLLAGRLGDLAGRRRIFLTGSLCSSPLPFFGFSSVLLARSDITCGPNLAAEHPDFVNCAQKGNVRQTAGMLGTQCRR